MEENFEENHNEEKEYDVESPTSSLAIEGFVQGESEDNTVQSQSAAFIDEVFTFFVPSLESYYINIYFIMKKQKQAPNTKLM